VRRTKYRPSMLLAKAQSVKTKQSDLRLTRKCKQLDALHFENSAKVHWHWSQIILGDMAKEAINGLVRAEARSRIVTGWKTNRKVSILKQLRNRTKLRHDRWNAIGKKARKSRTAVTSVSNIRWRLAEGEVTCYDMIG